MILLGQVWKYIGEDSEGKTYKIVDVRDNFRVSLVDYETNKMCNDDYYSKHFYDSKVWRLEINIQPSYGTMSEI